MNETDSPALPKLKIQGVPIVADYGWLYNFKTIIEALEYVEDVSLSVDDPTAPLRAIQEQVD